MLRMNFPGRRVQRREEAEARQAARDKRATFEQLMLVRSRPGNSAYEHRKLHKLGDER